MNTKPKKVLKMIKKCEVCNKEFHPTRHEQRTCSYKCGAKIRKGPTKFNKFKANCFVCGIEVERQQKFKNNKNVYCSTQCHYADNITKYKGKNNPNFKNALIERSCKRRGDTFKTYHKKQKYCSVKCQPRVNLKKRGTTYERKAKKELEAKGYTVVRSAGSLGVADLIAFNDSEIKIIQVKATMSLLKIEILFKKDITQLRNLIVPANATTELWCWRNRKGWEKTDFSFSNRFYRKLAKATVL